jgi:hypothetical protein
VGPGATLTHYADTKRELFLQTTAFPGTVVLVNGYSHSFETDKLLTDYATTNAAGLARTERGGELHPCRRGAGRRGRSVHGSARVTNGAGR